ncbi:hypothetical protein OEA41_009569 [Lepraria neglecta]|uniref:Uncharacterized protein n=1 Tax=Lepraria neglecta TaxID=209136 RepID=A0AAD9Z628_9LECA|nr:hypothetical protein OEA41_009569 [Lepraria neglecta]
MGSPCGREQSFSGSRAANILWYCGDPNPTLDASIPGLPVSLQYVLSEFRKFKNLETVVVTFKCQITRDVLSGDKLYTRFSSKGRMVLLEDLEHFHFERPQVGVMVGNEAKTNCGRLDSLMKLDEYMLELEKKRNLISEKNLELMRSAPYAVEPGTINRPWL